MSLAYDAALADRGVEVALRVADGETVALLGPNGAGKSTVLGVIAGLLRPDRGRVVLDGRVLDDDHTHVPAHDRRVASLAQDPLLFPHLTVLDNVAFGPRSARVGRAAAREQARGWLEAVGVADLADRRPGALSGGQAQRVAVARALAAEPRLLLLDEPIAALDVAVAPALRQTLRRVLADRTAVIVTHEALDALLLADRVVVLDRGRVVEEGPVGEVLNRPRSAFAARLAGLNLVRGVWRGGAVHDDEGHRISGTPSEPLPEEGAPAVAVFSPRSVSVFLAAPGGSPRNAVAVRITDLEPSDGRVRVRAGALSADVTPQSAAELDLAPGMAAWLAVKATEVDVHRL